MKTFIALFLSLTICLYSCDGPFRHHQDPPERHTVNYSITNASPLFKKDDISIKLDTADHLLYVTLLFKGFKNFPFPINQHYKDTLVNTAFNFDFYYEGKKLQTDYLALHNSAWDADSYPNADSLSISTDTTNILTAGEVTFHIPMYAFHNLKKGKQTLEMSVSQTVFSDDATLVNKDSSTSTVHLTETKPLLNAQIKFDLTIPPIYESRMYGYGLVLRNDSAFSPSGMDNTLWNSSYPDIYWMIYYPTDTYYTKTLYETSTAEYTAYDTFNIYHYYANDSIGIGVYDHDDLSQDDGMGYWIGPLARLSKHPVNRIKFGDVKSFDAKVVRKGIIN